MTHEQEIEIETESTQPIVRIAAEGNTRIHGGDVERVRAEGPGVSPTVEEQDDVVLVLSEGDCVVYVPRHARVEIDVSGDLLVEGVAGGVGVIACKGNATITDVGELHIHELKGDLRLSQAATLDADEIRGNAHIGTVSGPARVNAKGDIHAHQIGGPIFFNAKGNVHLDRATGAEIQVNAKGDCHLHHTTGHLAVNAAGNIHLHQIASKRVRAIAKGDVAVHFAEKTGGQAKVVTNGDLHLRGAETEIHKGRGVYSFRFGQGETVLSVVSKGNTILESIDLDITDLRAVNEDMAEELAGLGAEIGAEMGALGAEMGREFGNLGRDIARQVQNRVQRKLRVKMQELGKRAAKTEWGDSKSWSINLGDLFTPPQPPSPPPAPGWDAPFDPVDEKPAGDPVSDEERGLVLRMLEEGKISADEAATLLEALGDAA